MNFKPLLTKSDEAGPKCNILSKSKSQEELISSEEQSLFPELQWLQETLLLSFSAKVRCIKQLFINLRNQGIFKGNNSLVNFFQKQNKKWSVFPESFS